jgi:hypothetical protein
MRLPLADDRGAEHDRQDEAERVPEQAMTDSLETAIRNRPCRFVLFREIGLGARTTKDWLIKGLLGAGEASAFFGAPGDGKSVLVEDIGLHVAANAVIDKPWHDRKVKGGAVVYFALERKAVVERRALAFKLEHDIPDDLPFAIVGGGGMLDFRDGDVCKRITDVITAAEAETGHKVILIIIDTLSRALCGGDENGPKDMGAIIRATGILQSDGGRHVMWVHHVPHGTDRLRGHGSLDGALDTEIHVKHDPSSKIRRATVIKANDSEEGEQIAFTLKSVTLGKDDDGAATTAPVIVPLENVPKPEPKKPTKIVGKALTLLIDIIREFAVETIRPWNDLQVEAASVEAVRLEFYRRWTNESADAKKHAFNRAINTPRVIGVRDGKCWIISDRRKPIGTLGHRDTP